jgi:hypothetical protein
MKKQETYVIPNERIIIYTAGLLDGEGCIKIGYSNRCYYFLEACISNTNYEVIQWLKNNWNFGSVDRKEYTEYHSTFKTLYCWRNFSENASFLLDTIYPYLIIKKAEAFIGITFLNHRKFCQNKYGNGRKPENYYSVECKMKDLLLNNRQGNFEEIKDKVTEILNQEEL